MNGKAAVLDALVADLAGALRAATQASRDAASYATHEESRAESKYDTQGIEASFLAAGQARQAKEIAAALVVLREGRDALALPRDTAGPGALVEVLMGRDRDLYLVLMVAGGRTFVAEGTSVTTITPASPLGMAINGRRAGDAITLPNGARATLASVR